MTMLSYTNDELEEMIKRVEKQVTGLGEELYQLRTEVIELSNELQNELNELRNEAGKPSPKTPEPFCEACWVRRELYVER
jgi:predicted  nucleic acid-binding Zn-ribbon protein